jgi:hypothetical protein
MLRVAPIVPEMFRADIGVPVQTMAETLSERELDFNEGLQAAIDYFKGCASAIGKIDGNASAGAHRAADHGYRLSIRSARLEKRSDAGIEAALNAEIARSA